MQKNCLKNKNFKSNEQFKLNVKNVKISGKIMLCYKIHKSKFGNILAVADAALVGKKFKFNNLTIWVNPRFYGETKVSKEWLLGQVKNKLFLSVNFIGAEAVAFGREVGLIDEENILMLGKIPHAHCVLIF